jgi:hypothetical protein
MVRLRHRYSFIGRIKARSPALLANSREPVYQDDSSAATLDCPARLNAKVCENSRVEDTKQPSLVLFTRRNEWSKSNLVDIASHIRV